MKRIMPVVLLVLGLMPAAVEIPVFASSLIQVPLVYHLTGAAAPVGVLTASGDNLSPAHFAAIGAADIPVLIQGMEGHSEFNDVIIEAKRTTLDIDKIEAEVLTATSAMIEAHPKIRGIVLECTDMPPYAHRLQARSLLSLIARSAALPAPPSRACRR